MELRELGRVSLFCGTIVYRLAEAAGGYTIFVKNIDTGEACAISGISVSEQFVSELMTKLINGSVTPVTAYDVIRDALCDLSCRLQQKYDKACI